MATLVVQVAARSVLDVLLTLSGRDLPVQNTHRFKHRRESEHGIPALEGLDRGVVVKHRVTSAQSMRLVSLRSPGPSARLVCTV